MDAMPRVEAVILALAYSGYCWDRWQCQLQLVSISGQSQGLLYKHYVAESSSISCLFMVVPSPNGSSSLCLSELSDCGAAREVCVAEV